MTADLHKFMIGLWRTRTSFSMPVTFRINFLRWPEDPGAPR
jgi:hypothetical protein